MTLPDNDPSLITSQSIASELNSPSRKRVLNDSIFTVVASRYHLATRVLSFNQDMIWKNLLIKLLPLSKQNHIVDLACGTGDITFALKKKYPKGTLIGLDLNQSMLKVAKKRADSSVNFIQLDMNQLCLQSSTVSLVTAGYALRNAPDLTTTLSEIYRILQPDGYFAYLEFSSHSNKTARWLSIVLLKLWGNIWGVLFHGNPAIYGYIAESLRKFPKRSILHQLLEQHGMQIIHSELRFLGLIEICITRKRSLHSVQNKDLRSLSS